MRVHTFSFNITIFSFIERKCNESPYIGRIDQYKKEWSYIVEANQDAEAVRNRA